MDSYQLRKAREKARQQRFQKKATAETPMEELKEQIQGVFGKGERRYKVSSEELTLFTRQLSTMMGSGIPLHQALIYYGETNEGDLPFVIRKVANDVTSGFTFSNAMRAYPTVFNQVYISLAEMGEQSGQLNTAFKRLADLMERQTNMKKRVVSALTYPCVLLVVSTLAIAGFIYYVLPMMEPMFTSTGMPLPLPTKILLSLRVVVPLGTLLLILTAIGVWLSKPWLRVYFKENPGKLQILHAIPLQLPVISGIFGKLATARVLYSMATMLDAGMTMTDTIKRSSAAAGNAYIAHKLMSANERIMEGSTLGEALSTFEVFPSGAIQMLAVGEESANLSDMVAHVARLYDSEVELALNDIASILEPVIMVVMGGVVGFIVLAAIMPTVQLIQNL